MLSQNKTNIIIEAIGKNHISKIAERAKEKEVVKENGEPYSNTMLSLVLHGKRENAKIEDHIIETAEYYQSIKESNEKRLSDLEKRMNKK